MLLLKIKFVTNYLILMPWMCTAYLDDSGIYTHLTKCKPGMACNLNNLIKNFEIFQKNYLYYELKVMFENGFYVSLIQQEIWLFIRVI